MHLGSCGKKLLSVGSESITEGQVGAAAPVRLRTGVPADNQEAAGCTGPAEGPESGRGPREAAGARRSLALEFCVYDGKSAPVSRRGETGFAFRFHRLVPGSDFVTEHRVVEEGRSEAGSALGEPHGSDSDGR